MQHIATIRSVPVTKTIGSLDIEDGLWECVVEVDLEQMSASGDPKGFINKLMAESLLRCKSKSGLPHGEGLWAVEFSYWAQRNFNYPEGFIL